jgi:hypothetical protein
MAGMPKRGDSANTERARLVHALAQLPDEERRAIVADARREARRNVTLAWASLRAARGVVSLGGDAVVDCDRLYDG